MVLDATKLSIEKKVYKSFGSNKYFLPVGSDTCCTDPAWIFLILKQCNGIGNLMIYIIFLIIFLTEEIARLLEDIDDSFFDDF